MENVRSIAATRFSFRRFVVVFALLTATCGGVASARADTLDTVRTRGSLVIGYRTDAAPFSALGPQGKAQGYSIDLCNRIADDVKTALGMPGLKVDYAPVTADNRIDKLEAGAIDIECGSTTRTLSRQQQVDFTLFTFLTGTEILVPLTSGIHGPRDLANKKIAVQTDTTTERALKQLLGLLLVDGKLMPVKSAEEGLALVESGGVDGYASDQVLLIGLALSSKNPRNLRLSGYFYSYEPYALMVRKNDAAFRLIADRTLATIFAHSEIETIYKRWFGDWNPNPPPLVEALFAIESLGP
jgi:glutamate/aspartate transport system substrate-binding protein